jgi:peptidoglycan/LPS O-acetylase OafA/YrhL
VLLFFVLSGFVLALPYWSGREFQYGPFTARRWARVWMPYMAVVTLAALLGLLLSRFSVPGMSVWFTGSWTNQSWEGYLNHLLLIGNLEQFGGQFIPVVWSLRYEMLASLAFPLLLYLGRSLSWPVLLALGGALNVLAYAFPGSLRPLQFVLMFLVGLLLARHKDALVIGFRRLPRVSHVPLLAMALALYICSWLGWQAFRTPLESAMLDWGITAAAAFAIIVALASRTAQRLLMWRPVRWVGRVSYSVYLTHTLVLFTVLHLLGRALPIWLLLLVCVPLTLLSSAASYRWVEKPAIEFGRRFSARKFL